MSSLTATYDNELDCSIMSNKSEKPETEVNTVNEIESENVRSKETSKSRPLPGNTVKTDQPNRNEHDQIDEPNVTNNEEGLRLYSH